MFYTRGSSDDFDRYAEVTGDPGWTWNNVQTYFRRVSVPSPFVYHEICLTGRYRTKNGRPQLMDITLQANMIRQFIALLA